VVTRKSPDDIGGSYEYALHKVGGEWLIASIATFFSSRGQRPAIAELILDPALQPLPIERLPTGLEKLFDGEHVILAPYGEGKTRVQDAGFMTNHSGFLACGDPFEWSEELSFFDLRIPPGSYPIQLALADNSLAAARVIFDAGRHVSSYALATQIMPPNSGRDDWTREMSHLQAVRGNAGLGDAALLASCSSDELERMYFSYAEYAAVDNHPSHIVEAADHSNIVYFSGGNGGCMPFWALSESGEPLMLYIDFVEYSQKLEEGSEEKHFYDFVDSSRSDDLQWTSLATRLELKWPEHITGAAFRQQYRENHRHYHTVQHLNECLTALDDARSTASIPDADAIELALWFHDAIYVPGAENNEEESARIAELCLNQAEAHQTLIASIKRLILATKNHQDDGQEDAKWLIDIDLAILGQSQDRVAEYERQIRKEYDFVTEDLYREKRIEILEGFLRRPRLYQTDYFYRRLEQQARSNLQGLISALKR
ncbi:MAG: hypothetical protein KDK97_10750, partial [Verrucomicrobiales bacterium]|nr:hypothetical protein [Verrucomicrobiales bacterium]